MHTFKVIPPPPISEGSSLSWMRFLGTHHIPGRAGRSDRHSSACCRSGTLLSSWSASARRGTSGTPWRAWHKSGTQRWHLVHPDTATVCFWHGNTLQTHPASPNHKYNFFVLRLRLRAQEKLISNWGFTLTGISVREAVFSFWLLFFFLLIAFIYLFICRSTQRYRNSLWFQVMSVWSF